jgi:hypothetical protein
MNKKHVIKNLLTNSYYQNRGSWSKLVKVAKMFDNIGDAEDELINIFNTGKIIEIRQVYVK